MKVVPSAPIVLTRHRGYDVYTSARPRTTIPAPGIFIESGFCFPDAVQYGKTYTRMCSRLLRGQRCSRCGRGAEDHDPGDEDTRP